MLSTTRRIVAAALALPMMFSVTGCTDEQVLASVAGIAIVGGAVAIGAAAANNDRDHRDHHRHHDRYDRPRHGGGHWDRGHRGRPGRYYSANLESNGALELSEDAKIAAHYDIPVTAAERFNSSMKRAVETRDLQPIYELGLTKADLENLGELKMVSESGLNSLAAKLELSNDKARTLVKQMLADFKAQAKDSKSALWQSCMSSGHWRTPQNLSCTATFHPGCSPETGATICAAAN